MSRGQSVPTVTVSILRMRQGNTVVLCMPSDNFVADSDCDVATWAVGMESELLSREPMSPEAWASLTASHSVTGGPSLYKIYCQQFSLDFSVILGVT